MITKSGITVVITVTDSEGVTNLPHYKNSRPENFKKVVVGVGFHFRIPAILRALVILLDEFNPSR